MWRESKIIEKGERRLRTKMESCEAGDKNQKEN